MSVMAADVPEQRPVPSSAQIPAPDGYVWGTAFLEHGLSYRRLDYWTRVGYLKATQDHVGSGFKRVWAEQELGIAVAIMRLVDVAGIDLRRAVEIARGQRPADGSWEVTVLAPGLRLVATHELWTP